MLHLTNPCAKRKVLSLTKPKGKIYKTKSLRNYITQSCGHFHTTQWMYHMDFNKTYGEKAWLEPERNDTCCLYWTSFLHIVGEAQIRSKYADYIN